MLLSYQVMRPRRCLAAVLPQHQSRANGEIKAEPRFVIYELKKIALLNQI